MRATVDPLTDERWDELVAGLRSARPVPAPALRERVLAAAAATPPPSQPRARRAARVLVPALAVALVGVAGLAGSRSLGPLGGDEAAESIAVSPQGRPAARPSAPPAAADVDGEASAGEALSAAPFSPTPPGRLQEQHIALGVRVPDVDALADATARAMEAARTLGGYVVAAHYDVPSPEGGDSTLVVRVPVTRVQEAIARFTALGTIASQDVRLQDLQPAYDRRERELDGLRGRIARLEVELAAPGLGEQERARLRTQLDEARRAVAAREAQQRAAEQQGRLARVELLLTTRTAGPPPPADDGAAATLRAAAELLKAMLVWTGAALIVAGPFLLLAGLAVAASRTRRRVLQARLLERS
jgi:hypothetical protein